MTKPDPVLFLDDHRGIYIPRDFVESIVPEALSGVDPENIEILKEGPDHEWYWEAWEDVMSKAVVTDKAGFKYSIYQDGACWLIPDGMEWSDEEDWYVWPAEDDDAE